RSPRCRPRASAASPSTVISRPTYAAHLQGVRRAWPSAWALAVGGLLVGALALRLWGSRQGLPYVYNVDEASNFVPTAVSFYFTGSWNPHYFVNPPAYSYLLHAVFATWFGGGWPFGAKHDVARAYATDPTATFVAARATAAVLGTGAVGFLYLTGARPYDRRGRLLAGGVIAV